MLDWLSEKHGDSYLAETAERIRKAVEQLLADGAILTRDLGGTAGTQEVTDAVCKALS